MKKRILSVLLVFIMVLGMLPAQVFAADAAQTAQTAQNPFTDIQEADWYYDAVRYAQANGLFNGTSAMTFQPDGPMTRGMFITVLGRMAGVDASAYQGESTFSDVAANAYYAPYAAWAAKHGITNGVGGGRFDPDSAVDRQQMATFFVSYFEEFKVNYTAGTEITTVPGDMDTVADYAKDSVGKLWRTGLLNGTGGNFNPTGNASRAEVATLAMRTDKVVERWYSEPGVPSTRVSIDPNSLPPKDETKPSTDGTGGDDDSTSGGGTVHYTVTFESGDGSAVGAISLSRNAALKDLPTPYLAGSIFLNWCYDSDLARPVVSTDRLTGPLTLHAQYQKSEGTATSATPNFTSKTDVEASFTMTVNSSEELSAEVVKSLITAKNLSDDEDVDFIAVSGGSGSYTIASKDTFTPGGTYKITLNDARLTFAEQESSVREYNFTVARADEVMDLELNDGVKYIPADLISNVTESGAAVASLDVALLTVSESGTSVAEMVLGTFTYGGENLKEGDTAAIYEGLSPEKRTAEASGDDKSAPISYVIITEVNGSTYSYKSADVADVIFTPDVLPVPAKADTDGDTANSSITVPVAVMTYTDEKYTEMGLSSQTTIDENDFIAFYTGALTDEKSPVESYAQITSVKQEPGNYIIGYKNVTQEEVLAAMEVYDTEEISGEALLQNVNKPALEQSIARQATESGFVDEASNYLAAMALSTDSFTQLDGNYQMSAFSMTDANGTPVNRAALRAAPTGPKVEITRSTVDVDVGTKLQHFSGQSGVRVELTVNIELTIHAADGADIVINVSGTFEQELRVSLNVSAGLVWKWAWIFPYIDDFKASVSVDLYTYTGIGVKATITTDDGAPEDISSQLKGLMEKGSDAVTAASLQERYKEMLETESDWVDLVNQNLFTSRFNVALIFTVETDIDFVVSANMNISLGCEFMYENAKRYTYSLRVFAGRVTSDTINLVDEHYSFEFYVMGTMGLRAGIRAEVSLSLITKGVAYVAITAEAGAYTKLWGYFYYKYDHFASSGSTSKAAGALLVEVGVYLKITFTASAIGGRYSYSPTLYENEWPLWKAGTAENITGFYVPPSDALKVGLKNDFQTDRLPEGLFELTGFSLTTGNVLRRNYNIDNFTITLTNPAFTYDRENNSVTVNPGSEPVQDGAMVITWSQPLAFSSAPIQRTVPLHWDNLRDGYYIAFNSNGGSAVRMLNAAYGAAIAAPEAPTRPGYVFGGWYLNDTLTTPYEIPATMPNSDTLAYAKWMPATDTPYTVEHYQQELNGTYTLAETEMLNGTTKATVTPACKSDDGYTAPAEQSVTIAADGSSMVRYYYTRSSYSFTFKSDKAGVKDVTSTFKYGAAVSAPSFAAAGYSFADWSEPLPETMPAKDMTVTANWAPATDTPYRVEYYLQNANGDSYVLDRDAIAYKIGTTNELAEVIPPDYEYYNAGDYEPITIAANGSAVAKVYYDRRAYTITYNLNAEDATFNDSDEDSKTATARHGATVETLTGADMTRTGYGFAGWYINADCTQPFYGVMPTEDLTVYAGWEAGAVSYTVQHYQENPNNDGYTLEKSETHPGIADSEVTPAVKAYDGFTTPTPETVTIAADGSTVVTYKYTRNTYALTWEMGDGSASASDSYTQAGSVKHGADLTAPTGKRIGYTFVGWTTEVPEQMPMADSTYTAQWTPVTVQVSFDANEGEGEMDSISVTYGEDAQTLTENTFITRTHYTFAGWKTAQSGSGDTYGDGGKISNLTEDVILYAQWTPVTYSITYKLGIGSTGNPANPDKYTVESDNIRLTAPTRNGYTFTGWTGTNVEKPDPNLTILTSSGENRVYTAHWELIKYTITFLIDGQGAEGTPPDSIEYSVEAPAALPASPFKLLGHHVKQWSTRAGGAGDCYDAGSPIGDIFDPSSETSLTLYPVWLPNTFTVDKWSSTDGRSNDLRGLIPDLGAKVTYGESGNIDFASILGFNGLKIEGGDGTVYENLQDMPVENDGHVSVLPAWKNEGDGSRKPYLIYSRSQLEDIKGKRRYQLMTSLDLSEEAWSPIIGEYPEPVFGIYVEFNGGNHTISGMHNETGSRSLGLFSKLSGTTVIWDLNITDVTFTVEIDDSAPSTFVFGAVALFADNATLTLNNVMVSDVKVVNKEALQGTLGGMIGGCRNYTTINVNGGSVKNLDFALAPQDVWQVGAIVGYDRPTVTVRWNEDFKQETTYQPVGHYKLGPT